MILGRSQNGGEKKKQELRAIQCPQTPIHFETSLSSTEPPLIPTFLRCTVSLTRQLKKTKLNKSGITDLVAKATYSKGNDEALTTT